MDSMKPVFAKELLNIIDQEHAKGRIMTQQQLLQDKKRMRAFQQAILQNKQLFKGKVVLEIACGMGLLSLLAAEAGASKVYALDASCLAHFASQFVHDNNLDSKITCIRGGIDEIELPDNVKTVDIIIADWTSYCLHYRNLLNKVLRARNKWLVPGGLIFPDRFYLYIQGINNKFYKEEHVDWWNNVYGFKMTPISKAIKNKGEGINYWTEPEQLVTSSGLVQEIDMYTEQPNADLISGSFRLHTMKNDCVKGLILYFHVQFKNIPRRFAYNTCPHAGLDTFYGQVMLCLDDYIPLKKGDRLDGKLEIETGCCLYKHTMHGLDLHLSLYKKNQLGDIHILKKQYCLNNL